MLAEEHKSVLMRKKELEQENTALKMKLKVLIPKEVGTLHSENQKLQDEIKAL